LDGCAYALTTEVIATVQPGAAGLVGLDGERTR
jgi:hypothetical protein